jgi:hypothetical protein
MTNEEIKQWNSTKKRGTIILVILFFIGIIAIIFTFSGIKTLASGYSYSVDYSKKNNTNVNILKEFISSNDLLNDSINSSFIQFFIKRKENVHIIRFSKNGRFETTKPTPEYFEDLFLGNKMMTLSVKKEGIVFKDIFFLWGSKICSLKYFFKPHNLTPSMIYEEKYMVTNKETLNTAGETCCIIDENWVLLIVNEK